MVKTFATIAATLAALWFAGLMPASAQSDQRANQRTTQPAAPAAEPTLNPLDVPRWMGDAVGRILSEPDDPAVAPTRPTRQ